MIPTWVQEGLVAARPGVLIYALKPPSFIINKIH